MKTKCFNCGLSVNHKKDMTKVSDGYTDKFVCSDECYLQFIKNKNLYKQLTKVIYKTIFKK